MTIVPSQEINATINIQHTKIQEYHEIHEQSSLAVAQGHSSGKRSVFINAPKLFSSHRGHFVCASL